MPALDLALRLRMVRRTVDMARLVVAEPVGEVALDVTRSIVGQQSQFLNDVGR